MLRETVFPVSRPVGAPRYESILQVIPFRCVVLLMKLLPTVNIDDELPPCSVRARL